MCGISGYFSPEGLKFENKLQKMLDIMHHRGPDFQDFKILEHCGFAHNRLSLLDLTNAGNQPFFDADNLLVFNGEIYNFLELKNQLPAINYTSTSDTAVLFHALKTWGIEKTLQKIKGMFAFAWYNNTTKKMILARDRYGIKPLFYGYNTDKSIWFSSEIKALLPVINTEVNHFKILFSTFGNLEREQKNTAWKNIFHIEPGTYLEINTNSSKINRYYSIFDTIDKNLYDAYNKMNSDEIVSEFNNLLNKSIISMNIADAPLGAFVSGGIDSNLIALYSKNHNPTIKLFTANILGKHSEYKDTLALAQSLNANLYDYKFHKDDILRDWVDVTWHYESPLVVHFNAIPFSNVAKLTREHNVKAVLTGEAADELFLGYPNLLQNNYIKAINFPYKVLDTFYSKTPIINKFLSKQKNASEMFNFLLNSSGSYNSASIIEQKDKYSFVPKSDLHLYMHTPRMFSDHLLSLLWRNDRMGMKYSIESRFPYLDENIVAFAMNLPVKFKIGKTLAINNIKHPFLIDKHIVRKLAENKLPSQLVKKPKKGFPITGLRNVSVQPDYFYNSYVSNIFNLTNNEIRLMFATEDSYVIAKLVALEIWGNLFIENIKKTKIIEKLNRFVKII